MSDPATTVQSALAGGRATPPQAAIAQAAQRTGVDFSYLLAQARIESDLDPQARASTSSASGLFQFIDQTWLATLDRHGEQLGYTEAARAIETRGGRARITDPAMRDEIMALRFDPQASSMMAGALATDNRAALMPVLGREPDGSELYMAHFLGADGAARFLSKLSSDPDASAASLLPRAAGANRAIFYERSGVSRSVSEVMDLVRGRVEAAMELGGAGPAPMPAPLPAPMPAIAPSPSLPGWTPPSAPNAPDYGSQAPMRHAPPLREPQPLPSMAATLRNSFGLAAGESDAAAPGLAHVRNAYARLEAFGL